MKNKGFTLIELLSVIGVLALIALITIPKITGVLKRSKRDALKDNVAGIVKSANTYVAKNLGTDYIEFDFTNSNTKTTLNISGDLPSSGKLAINKNGDIAVAAKEGKYCAYKNYDERTVTVEECTTLDLSIIKNNIAVGEPVYLDPTNLNTYCNATNSTSTTGTKTGCMKWYIIGESNNKYKLLLDHNTTATVEWITQTDYNDDAEWNINQRNGKGPITANNQLATDTAGWKGNPRLITANEVAAITENTGWSSATATSSQYFYFGSNSTTEYSNQSADQKAKQRRFAWLFDYTNGCTSYGCNTADSSTYGYWTSSPVSGSSTIVWHVNRGGFLNFNRVDIVNNYGIRPVIEIDKDKID